MLLAVGSHEVLKHSDPLGQPGQFRSADLAARGIAGIDVGAAQKFEAVLLELGFPQPRRGQARVMLLAPGAQEFQLVGLGELRRAPDYAE